METMEKVMRGLNSGNIYSLQKCDRLTVVQSIAPPKLTIFNYCWKIGTRTGSCPIPTEMPVVSAGSKISITADIANSGPTGRANVIFKIDGVAQYNDTNVSLATFPGGGLWSPTYSGYTMPTKDVQLTIEAYAWDATKNAWVITDTKTTKISTVSAGCTGLDLVPFSAIIKQGEKVDFVVSTSPGNIPFTVTFKGRSAGGSETVLGTCKTSGAGQATGGSTCGFTWDSNVYGKQSGTYYVKAYADSCISTEGAITVNPAILQYNFGITVKDSNTGAAVSGASVQISTAGGASQSKVTDINGLASFRVDSGTINVSISKNGYNTYNTAEYVFMDRSITYPIVPTSPLVTVGNVQFVSVPTGVDIYIDSKSMGVKTPITITDIKAGDHTFSLKLTTYEDLSGTMTVLSGSTINIYVTLTRLTPNSGSINITSHPMGADVWIDGKDTGLTTSGATVIDSIPPGNHTYTLTMTGFQDKTGTFAIVSGQTTFLDVELVPLTTIGSLEISSDPSGARVYIDDADSKRTTPATILSLAAGDHTYKLVLEGYKEISGIFTIESGKATTVHIVLEKSVGIEIGTGVAIAVAGALAIALLLPRGPAKEV